MPVHYLVTPHLGTIFRNISFPSKLSRGFGIAPKLDLFTLARRVLLDYEIYTFPIYSKTHGVSRTIIKA
jgi:hypothetical protein